MLAVISIKTDSQELYNKNLLNFCGKPMYQWAIEACLKSVFIDKIMLLTSDNKFLEKLRLEYKDYRNIAVELKLKWLDNTELLDVMKYAQTLFESNYYVQIQPNKPNIDDTILDYVIADYFKSEVNTLFTVQKINTAVNWKYQANRQASNGNFKSCALVKIWDYESLFSAQSGTWGFGKKHKDCFIGNKYIEIDNIEDFKIAELIKRKDLNLI
jgi:CMP-N-acetylneuraminic acid synthetase